MLIATLLLMVNSVVPTATEYDAIGALGYMDGLFNGNTWHCAATLVTPTTVATAKHCLDIPGAFAVRFRRATDGSIGSIEVGPGSFHNVAVAGAYIPVEGWAALLYLAEPVEHILPIPLKDGVAWPGPVTIGGWGREGPPIGQGQMRELRICESEIVQIGQYGHIYFPTAWDNVGPGCGPNSNDSGGPLIEETNRGGPVVSGVVLGSGTAAPLGWLP